MEDKQKMMLEFNILENQAKQIEQQILLIDQQLAEFQNLQQALEDSKKVKNQKILSPIGKGIFFESEAKEIKEIYLDIGSGVVLKKSIKEAGEIIEKQMQKFLDARSELNAEFSKIIQRINEIGLEIV